MNQIVIVLVFAAAAFGFGFYTGGQMGSQNQRNKDDEAFAKTELALRNGYGTPTVVNGITVNVLPPQMQTAVEHYTQR